MHKNEFITLKSYLKQDIIAPHPNPHKTLTCLNKIST